MSHYTFTCLWRPPKDHWPLHGAKWRSIIVVVDSTDRPELAACDACLYLIAVRRGQAKAISVAGGPAGPGRALSSIHFNWSWYCGVVTWGGNVVDVFQGKG